MSDVLVLNEGLSKKGGKKAMKRRSFRRIRIPRLREGIGSLSDFGMGDMGLGRGGVRRFRMKKVRRSSRGRFLPTLRMDAVPWTKGSSSHGWFKRRMGGLLKPSMKSMWSTFKRGKWGKTRKPAYHGGLFPSSSYAPAMHSLALSDDSGLVRMSGGWLPAINLLGIGSMGLGLVSVYAVPRLGFIPDMLKSGIGRVGLQLGTGLLGNALLTKIVKRPDLGYHFFTGAIAGTILDALNTYVFKGQIPLASSGVGLGVYVDRTPPNNTGIYVDRTGIITDKDEDDDE